MPEKTATFASRLKEALAARGMSQADLARISGVDKSRITRYLQGKYLAKQDAVYALAKALDVSEAWLMGWTDETYDWENDPEDALADMPDSLREHLLEKNNGDPLATAKDYRAMQADAANEAAKMREAERKPVPIPAGFEPPPKMKKVPLIGDIACGDPITAEQNVVDYLDVPEDVHCDFCLRCHGDSMIDAHIQDGDVVYIHCQPEVHDGEIAAVRIGDEATLKRVYYDGQNLTLVPCNTAYRPKTYSGPDLDDIQIEGRMVGFTHWGSR